MNINRHNYETFFLLYVDNELPIADRKTVEEFVQENADLKPELQSLLDAILPGETFSYDSPELLYKDEIELDTLQENLLLHLDNELDAVSKKDIEEKILLNNAIKKEWQVWEQTKLDAGEQIVFRDKQLLYHHEKAHIISIRFWRIAAAAAILLLGLFTGISILKKDKPAESSTAKIGIKTRGKKQTGNKNIITPAVNIPAPSEKIPTENIVSTQPAPEMNKKNIIPVTTLKSNKVPGEENDIAAEQPIKNNKPVSEKTSLEYINKQKSNETNASVVLNNKGYEIVSPEKIPGEIANTSIKGKITPPVNPVVDYNSVPAMPDSYAKTAVLNEGGSGNNDKIFYMNQETVNRSRIGGIFRRVKRVIERNTNIKTGNGVKIAGFEIALK